MKAFTDLYIELDQTTRTNEKVEAMVAYFRAAAPLDAAWAVYVLSGRKLGRSASATALRDWASEVSGYPLWLVNQCYSVAGDLSETLSLLLPPGKSDQEAPALHEIIEERIRALGQLTKAGQRQVVLRTWDQLNTDQRLVYHKLLSGNYRVGVSRLLLIRALAETGGIDPALVAHRMAGTWMPDEKTMQRLICAHDPCEETDPALPYPFMLAHPLKAPPETLGAVSDWLVEWKWDGIRAQLIKRAARPTLWSRGDESVSSAFPDVLAAACHLPDGTVLDGEIVAWDEKANRPLPFTQLQPRINRLNVEMTFWTETVVRYVAFDLLEIHGRDVRGEPLAERRRSMGALFSEIGPVPVLGRSEALALETWEAAREVVADSRRRGVEGIMLKRLDSQYETGRPTGLWWKLKIDPFTMDAVMIAAEPGHGRRAGLLTDYTFGVWDNGALVPITKAYSGLTDVEIAEMDRFARRHTTAKHGPVHLVEPLRVFEIGFEAIQVSTRHKSGLAVRFPRILRIRDDKKPVDADSLQSMRDLLKSIEAMR